MWTLSNSDRMRLGTLLATRARNKTKDALIARERGRHPDLIVVLESDAAWSREMASMLMSNEELRG